MTESVVADYRMSTAEAAKAHTAAISRDYIINPRMSSFFGHPWISHH
jgi:hypothetical protein